MVLNKKEFAANIAEIAGSTKKDAEAFMDCFMTAVADSLSKGDTIKLVGFGTFSVKTSTERNGVNPKTGEPIIIPARAKPTFKAGKTLKDAL